jgi:hypothetical protein
MIEEEEEVKGETVRGRGIGKTTPWLVVSGRGIRSNFFQTFNNRKRQPHLQAGERR